jgi:hypothetical protein
MQAGMKYQDRGSVLGHYLNVVIPIPGLAVFEQNVNGFHNYMLDGPFPTGLDHEVGVARIALVVQGDADERQILGHGGGRAIRLNQFYSQEGALAAFLNPLTELCPVGLGNFQRGHTLFSLQGFPARVTVPGGRFAFCIS